MFGMFDMYRANAHFCFEKNQPQNGVRAFAKKVKKEDFRTFYSATVQAQTKTHLIRLLQHRLDNTNEEQNSGGTY